MVAMTFGSDAIEVPADVAEARVYVDVHDEINHTPVHMLRLDLNEDQAVELATLLMLAATKLRAERLARQDDLDAAYAAREAVEDIPTTIEGIPEAETTVQPVQRKLSPCYCDSVYHSGGC